MEYQGWTNKATWQINLYLTNTEGEYAACRSIVEAARKGGEDAVGQQIAEYVTEMLTWDNSLHPVARELLRDVISSVNWGEIAHGFMAD